MTDEESNPLLGVRASKDGNVVTGDVLIEDSRGNLVRSDSRLVAAVGVENLVIVSTNDAVLVASRERDQDVKRIVDSLMKAGRNEAQQPARMHRPWGSFEGWSGVVREAVVFAGLPDPGETRVALQTTADRDAAAMTDVIAGLDLRDAPLRKFRQLARR